ncbi:MAG: hypothetical protein WDN46_06600 [Methylocella sp.]
MPGITKKPRRPTARQIDNAFAPYALEIGRLTRAWNGLHNMLGEIFSRIISRNNVNISRAIWHSLMSDKTQRDILKAAYQAPGAIDSKVHPKAIADLKWLIKNVDDLGFRRNDAIHAPMLVGKYMRTGEMVVLPDIYAGNPRAIKLHEKELLLELRWYRMCADTLAKFAGVIWFHLGRDKGSWPERPLLPTLGQGQTDRASRRKKGNAKSSDPENSI